jgi:hypothetical protein
MGQLSGTGPADSIHGVIMGTEKIDKATYHWALGQAESFSRDRLNSRGQRVYWSKVSSLLARHSPVDGDQTCTRLCGRLAVRCSARCGNRPACRIGGMVNEGPHEPRSDAVSGAGWVRSAVGTLRKRPSRTCVGILRAARGMLVDASGG